MRAVQPGCSAPCPLSLAVVLCSFGAVFRKSLYLAALGVKKHVTEKKIEVFFFYLHEVCSRTKTRIFSA